MSSPGIVHKVRFVQSARNEFSGFVEYIDRDEAIRKENFQSYSLYNDYMGNPGKTSGMFSSKQDIVSEEEKAIFKRAFQNAQEKGSLMWQDVFSFDNAWLEKHKLYDSQSGIVDEKKIFQAIRQSMSVMVEKENMKESALWLGAIHYNTDNVHVHIATVEVPPTRERGKRKPKTLEGMKSTFANSLLDRSLQNEKINSLIRDQMVSKKKEHSLSKNQNMRTEFKAFMNQLPKEDLRKWNYAYMKNLGLEEELNQLTKTYIETYHKETFQELQKTLNEQKEIYRETYGEGKYDKKLYENFVENKNKDLYKRMGNALLTEMREYEKERTRKVQSTIRSPTSVGTKYVKPILTSKDFNRIKQALDNEVDQFKNLRAYEQLEQRIRYEAERENQ